LPITDITCRNYLRSLSTAYIWRAVLLAVWLVAVSEHVHADADHRRGADSYTGSWLSSRHGKSRLAAG